MTVPKAPTTPPVSTAPCRCSDVAPPDTQFSCNQQRHFGALTPCACTVVPRSLAKLQPRWRPWTTYAVYAGTRDAPACLCLLFAWKLAACSSRSSE